MMYRPPSAAVALRTFKLAGTEVARLSLLTPEQMKHRAITMLLSRRWVLPVPETYGRTGRATTPTPTYLNPQARTSHLKDSVGVNVTVVAEVVGTEPYLTAAITVSATGIAPDWLLLDFGDGTFQIFKEEGPYQKNHTYAGTGTYTVSARLSGPGKFGSGEGTVVVDGLQPVAAGSPGTQGTQPDQYRPKKRRKASSEGPSSD